MHTTPRATSPTCGGANALTACRLSPEAVRKVACVSVTPAEADTCTSNVAGPNSLQNNRAQQQQQQQQQARVRVCYSHGFSLQAFYSGLQLRLCLNLMLWMHAVLK